MSSNLESKTKKELLDIINQLSDKLKEVKQVEEKQTSLETNLPGLAFSVSQDSDNMFSLIELKYNKITNAATVINAKKLETRDYQIAVYLAKEYLIKKIMVSEQLNHLTGEKTNE